MLGVLAAHLYGDPATDLKVIGVTGTQGKTTTTRILEQGLTASGVASAVIGTVGTRIAGEAVKTQLTTPEAPDLHGLFAVMRERGVDTCAMEVSSHALVLGRVDGVVFDVATFLNLGRDHLDFHADVDDYFAAKASLFTPERARRRPDQHRRRVRLPAARRRGHPDVDVLLAGAGRRLARRRRGPRRRRASTFTVVGPGVEVPAAVNLPGEFNVSNALAAIASAALAGLDPAAGRRRHRARRRRAGPPRAGRRGAGLHRRRRLRPQARRPRGRPGHPAPAHRGARSSSWWAPAATATPSSAR